LEVCEGVQGEDVVESEVLTVYHLDNILNFNHRGCT
jgi:hypothetical protein